MSRGIGRKNLAPSPCANLKPRTVNQCGHQFLSGPSYSAAQSGTSHHPTSRRRSNPPFSASAAPFALIKVLAGVFGYDLILAMSARGTDNRQPNRRHQSSSTPRRAAGTQEDRLEGSARPPTLASMSRGYNCPFRLKSSHMAACADQGYRRRHLMAGKKAAPEVQRIRRSRGGKPRHSHCGLSYREEQFIILKMATKTLLPRHPSPPCYHSRMSFLRRPGSSFSLCRRSPFLSQKIIKAAKKS